MADNFGPVQGSALEHLADEELVTLAQNGSRPAEIALIHRYLERIERRVRSLARKVLLGREDMEDAFQEAAAFWFPEAIRAYVAGRYAGPNGCCFRTLWLRIFRRRLANFVRGLRRRACYCTNAGGLADLAGQRIEGLRRSLAGGPLDPRHAAERHEVLELLACVVTSLSEADRALWDWMAAGGSLLSWARDRAEEYTQARRQWNGVFRRVTVRLPAGLGR
jgi:DNA-directed RNA polymerase specialized sigma24 family protein